MSIITSASSRTNTRILVKLINFRLKHQSRTVPGVPIIICSVISVPMETRKKRAPSDAGQCNTELLSKSTFPNDFPSANLEVVVVFDFAVLK